jgi:prepilin peptidase CpaA
MLFTAPPLAAEAILLLMVIIAAAYDIRYRRIPNWLTASGVLIGLVLNSFLQTPAPAVLSVGGLLFALKGFGLAFGVYFFLYALRAMGAGDVKLMAAVGSLVGWQDWFGIFLISAVIGGIAAIVLSLIRGRLRTTFWNVGFILSEMGHGRPAYLRKEELDVRSKKGLGLPHGAVIAAGTIIFLIAGHAALR